MCKQLTIIGSWTFSKIGQAECASFVADRKIAVEHLFTHRWRLAQAEDAYRVFNQQASGKGVFAMRCPGSARAAGRLARR